MQQNRGNRYGRPSPYPSLVCGSAHHIGEERKIDNDGGHQSRRVAADEDRAAERCTATFTSINTAIVTIA